MTALLGTPSYLTHTHLMSYDALWQEVSASQADLLWQHEYVYIYILYTHTFDHI